MPEALPVVPVQTRRHDSATGPDGVLCLSPAADFASLGITRRRAATTELHDPQQALGARKMGECGVTV